MAAVARMESLTSALAGADALGGSHVWLDVQFGLVTGTFPSPAARFDFAEEKLVSIACEKSEPKRIVSLLGEAKRVGQVYEIETTGAVYRVGSATQMLIHGLNLIEDERPGTLEILSTRRKRSKRPVARAHADLYDLPHPETHSAQLKSGYFVATNNKAYEALGYVREAVEIAGLKWGGSFVVRPA